MNLTCTEVFLVKNRAKLLLVLVLVCSLSLNCAFASVTTPKDTTVIPEQAFYGDLSLTEVELQEGLLRIEKQAFANTSLTSVLLPRSLEYFAEDAFEGCPDDLEIRVYTYSAAKDLCDEYGLTYTIESLGKIGISLPTMDLWRWEKDGAALKRALDDAGYETDLQYASNKPETQKTQVDAMIGNGCELLIICPIDDSALSGTLAKAKIRGIPVIAYDRLLMDTNAVSYYVTFNNYSVGVLQANYIIQALNLNGTGRSGNLEITAGDPLDYNGRKFYDGAMEVLQPYISSGRLVVRSGQTKFSAVTTNAWNTQTAQARAAGILEDYYSDGTVLDAWLCANDSTALGITNALINSSYAQSWPVITGQDCDLANVRNILAGTQSMSVFKETGILVDRAVEMAVRILDGEEVEVNSTVSNNTKNVPAYLCDPLVVDKTNYRELLINSGYYTEDQLQGGTPVPSFRRVGVSMPTAQFLRWTHDGEIIKTTLNASGYRVDLKYASNDEATQQAQIDAMIDSGCEVLIITPVSASSLGTVLEKAASENVKIIAYDRLLTETENVDCFVQFSYYAVGTLQGNFIRDALNLDDPGNTAGPFTLEITAGDPLDYNAQSFYDGGMAVLQPYITSGKLIVKSGETDFADVTTDMWSLLNAQERAERILAAYYADTDIDAWFCVNDIVAKGVITALQARNYSGRWPVITGLDCDPDNIRYILDGKQAMSVFMDTRILAERAANLAGRILREETPGTPDTTTGNQAIQVPTYQCSPVVVDSTNYVEYLIDSGYYSYEDLQ